ncbi:MAG: M56 family metallopeptidase [Lachnospiraceae bacterium]|nr:M56 family metallopeptidase [Lachnospiraceae bacterium]
MNHIFQTILQMNITASIVICSVLVVRFLLKRAPKIFSYVLWSVVLFRLICPVAIESNWGVIPVSGLTAESLISEAEGGNLTMSSAQDLTGGNQESVNSTVPMAEGSLNGEDSDVTNPNSMSMRQLVLWIAEKIWLCGIAVLMCYSVVSLINIKRKVASAQKTEENIYEVQDLETPFVFGIVKPLIYLPAGLTGEERIYILAHERWHIHRMDHLVKLLGYCVLLVHWFNPLVWLSFILMTKDMEMSCDEAVLRKFQGTIKKEYSTSLLNMAIEKHKIAGTPLAFGEENVKSRIKNVLRYKKAGVGILAVCLCVVVGTIMVLMTNRTPGDQVQEVELTEKNYPENLAQMYEWRTNYVGDNSAVGNITDAWFMDTGFSLVKNGIELQTDTEPYEVTVRYLSDNFTINTSAEQLNAEEQLESIEQLFEQNAALLFSLIENAGVVHIRINDQMVADYTRTELEEKFGELWSNTESFEGFCKVYDYVNYVQDMGNRTSEDILQEDAMQESTIQESTIQESTIQEISTQENTQNLEMIEQWATAFCDRDGEAIASMISDEVKSQMEEQGLLEQAGGTYTFGVSSPWPWSLVDSTKPYTIEVSGDTAVILYYAAVSDPHISVWRETIGFTLEDEKMLIHSETLEYLDHIASAEEFEKAYPLGIITGTAMDYMQNGLGEMLNRNAMENPDSEFYQVLFQPDTAAVYLLNLLKNENKVQTDYAYADDGTKDVLVHIDFILSNESVTIRMTQPFGTDGIWIPQKVE